jgi:UDP-3-O-[3-hydroxymyristoyl] glucosamine N-acyltransferase
VKIIDALKKAKIEKYEIFGDKNQKFNHPTNINDANKESIVFCARYRYGSETIQKIKETKASVIITDEKIGAISDSKTIIVVEKPRDVFVKILHVCFPVKIGYLGLSKRKALPYNIHPTAKVHEKASISKNAVIGANCIIGECTIRENTIIYPNVVINNGVKIGKNVVIKPGAVIGYDGFGYVRGEDNTISKFNHYGSVIVKDDVIIGANTTIDRGTLGDTVIGKGTKIDNLVHIAHNVVIGEQCMIIAHSMIGGSVTIGDFSHIAPNAAIRDTKNIGKNVLVGLGAVVIKDIPDNLIVVGNPAKELNSRRRNK